MDEKLKDQDILLDSTGFLHLFSSTMIVFRFLCLSLQR